MPQPPFLSYYKSCRHFHHLWVDGDWTAASTQHVPALKVELKEDETHSLCQQLWDMEKVLEVSRHTTEEESALQQFSSHLTRESDGRYSVKLPRVHNPPQLGDSRRMAKPIT